VVVLIAFVIVAASYLAFNIGANDGVAQGNYEDALKELAEKTLKLRSGGYAVTHIEYLILSSRYHYANGDVDKAWEILEEAHKELEDVELLPELPYTEYKVVDNVVDIARIPTAQDFVPLGIVYVKTSKGYIAYPRNDPKWKLSCFIMIAMGTSSSSEVFVYQGRLPLMPEEGSFKPRIFIGGRWVIPNIVFVGPLYYDEGELYGGPTVYQYDVSGRYFQRVTYIPENREWLHTIEDMEKGSTILEIRAEAVGTPMWLGEWGNRFIVHGVYAKKSDLDLWGGFWDIGRMVARVSYGGVTKEFTGFFVFDRASHRVYSSESARNVITGAPLAYTCMVIYQDDVTILITHSTNPSPLSMDHNFQHQLRINLLNEGITLSTVEFNVSDDGSLQPKVFHLEAVFEGGYLNLTGEVIGHWPSIWPRSKGTWWNPNGVSTCGRAFIHWTGTLTIGDRTIHIDAYGAGEFTRYSDQGGTGQMPSPTNGCSCWG